jgi:predicted metal-dependent hydrolase
MDVIGFQRGVELFNRAEFFKAHEVLEDVWRAAPMAEKKFLQGLIQVAVALHHHTRGNSVGARSLLKRAAKNLGSYPGNFAGIKLAELLDCIAEWERALADGKPVPPLPRFVVDHWPSLKT